MKRLISALIVAAMMLSFTSVFATDAPSAEVFIDGTKLECDVPPIIENGRTLVPMRAIFEALGANVYWDADTKTVTAVAGGTVVILQIGNELAFVNSDSHTLDVPAQIINDRTLVPARFASEALNATVEWDETNRRVNVTTAN